MAGREFCIEIVGQHHLTADEIWPDGDAPDNPTTDDVLAVMRKSGTASRLVSDWNLDFDVECDGKPAPL